MLSSASSTALRPPSTWVQRLSNHVTFSGGSWMRDGISTGRNDSWKASCAVRALRFAERTAEKVATASTRVPPAVASEEIVDQFDMEYPSGYEPRPNQKTRARSGRPNRVVAFQITTSTPAIGPMTPPAALSN